MKNKGVKVLSLFDGVSVAHLALDNIGVPIARYDAFEIEGPAIAISKHNFPDIVHHGDVRKIDLEMFKGYDLVCFGSPCQDFSSLNSVRLGLKGSKSSLFYYGAAAVQSGYFSHFLCENVRMSPESKKEISLCLGVEPVMYDSAGQAGAHRPRNYWTDVQWTPSTRVYNVNELIEDGWFAGFDTFGAVTCKLYPNPSRAYKRMMSSWVTNVVFRENPEGVYLHGCDPFLVRRYYLLEEGKRYDVRGLRPSEMERLMNMPEGYTSVSKRIYKTKGVVERATGAHSRAKAVGNSWTVSVIEDIFRAMFL